MTRGVVVMGMPVSMMRHMMTVGMVSRMMSMMHGGRCRSRKHQRGCNDNRQGRDDFTHERLHKEHFQ
jgi:hypothetical protein